MGIFVDGGITSNGGGISVDNGITATGSNGVGISVGNITATGSHGTGISVGSVNAGLYGIEVGDNITAINTGI